MKKTHLKSTWGALIAFIALVAFLAVGCGGGGGGASTTGGIGAGTLPAGQYLEFFRSSQAVDPLNLSVNDVIQVRVVNYDGVGNRTVLSANAWSLSGSNTSSANITSSGVLTFNTTPVGLITVTGHTVVAGSAKLVSQDVYVPSTLNTTTVSGLLFATGGVTPIGYAQVQFLDENGNLVGAARTSATGVFKGKVPSTAKKLNLKGSTVPTTYFVAIKYQNINYAATGVSCLVPLPTLTVGAENTMPSTLFMPKQTDGPPPPPNGC
ncbi:hypothetical protein QPK87_13875 [Kamptonema cortianum]|nr:hypothetical protein [Geitlerinema splendidum]MDK3157657.1 hypothetical protein [Kamptonema cortianum]